MHILLVEDDYAILANLTSFLRDEGFRIEAVRTQSDALAAIARGGLDLALVDITLAQGDGLAVCAGAKAAGLAVIFLTASGDENSVAWTWAQTTMSPSPSAQESWYPGSAASCGGPDARKARSDSDRCAWIPKKALRRRTEKSFPCPLWNIACFWPCLRIAAAL